MLQHNIDEAVLRSRHSILDKFLISTLIFGFLAALTTIWRDIQIGFVAANSISNMVLVAMVLAAWIYRRRASLTVKASVLFTVYFVMSVKQMMLFGPMSGAHLFLCFCCLILMLSMSVKHGLIVSVTMGLIFPIMSYLHFSGIRPVVQDFPFLLSSKAFWITGYASFVLVVFVVIVGVGQLRLELNRNFGLLRQSVIELYTANERLTKEIELKNEYADNLQISSKKFQSLFEGSRDGVLLLDGKAKIIEANQAVVEASGYSLEELKAIDIFQLVDERFRADALRRFEKNIRGDLQTQLNETTIVAKDGKRVQVEINSNLIISDDQVMVLSTVRDISFRKQLENEKFNAVLEAEERERERFSKDLHDDLGPVFSTLNLYLQTLSNKEADESKRSMLNNLSGIVDSAVKQVREISHNLSPHLLRRVGLINAIRTHLSRYEEQGIIHAEMDIEEDEPARLSGTIEIAVYRIFLELLNNTIKHSGATRVRIVIGKKSNELLFDYFDNGKGFNAGSRPQSGGIGLLNIESRVNALRGRMTFAYQNNEMAVKLTIPL